MIGVHSPGSSPDWGRRRLFSRWFIFQGKAFLSLAPLSFPHWLWLTLLSPLLRFPLSAFSLFCPVVNLYLKPPPVFFFSSCFPPNDEDETPPGAQSGMFLRPWLLNPLNGSIWTCFSLRLRRPCRRAGCSSMARLSGRCPQPQCEYRNWLSSADKVAHGAASTQQPSPRTNGWQLADGVFFPLDPRCGRLGPHAPGAVRSGGQLREAGACRDQPAGGRGGRRH